MTKKRPRYVVRMFLRTEIMVAFPPGLHWEQVPFYNPIEAPGPARLQPGVQIL